MHLVLYVGCMAVQAIDHWWLDRGAFYGVRCSINFVTRVHHEDHQQLPKQSSFPAALIGLDAGH